MDVEERKLFVGGIPRGTSEDNLRDHFSKYGVVSYLLLAKDQITKLPRGFAFVAFSDAASAARALEDSHVIHGRTVSFLLCFFFFHVLIVFIMLNCEFACCLFQ